MIIDNKIYEDMHDWPRHEIVQGLAAHWHYLAPLGFGFCFLYSFQKKHCINDEPGDFHDI